VVVLLTVLAPVLTACGGDKFNSEAYCEAIAEPGVVLDAKALIDGDEATLESATTLYASIRDKAPEDLKDDWAVLIEDLGEMLQTARGERDVTDSDYDGFAEAFTAIEQDKHERCSD
jgi:hypothetical protein